MVIDYIKCNIGKVIIIHDINEKTKKLFKEENNTLVDLTEDELKYVNSLFDTNGGYNYNDELDKIVLNNPNIEHKEYIINFLKWLGSIIPKNCTDNFYRNVRTLKTKLNLDVVLEPKKLEENENYFVSGGYDTINNILTIDCECLRYLNEIASKSSNPQETFNREYAAILLHELSHMASSKYDPSTKVSLSGFDKYPPTTEEDKNRGLTEGMTEVIAKAGVPGTIEIASGYYIEALIVNQLSQILGFNIMLESYFGNKGTKELERKLNTIIDNSDMSYLLFRRIETNYEIGKKDMEQSILGNVQNDLITYLIAKIEQDKKSENFNIEGTFRTLNLFEKFLITEETLKMIQKNPNNYVGINESVERFQHYKKEFENEYINLEVKH